MADDRPGVIAAARDVGRDLIATLPPAFVLLLAINIIFLALVMWFINSQITQRTELIEKVIDHCMKP